MNLIMNEMAEELVDLLTQEELFDEINIYVNNTRYSSEKTKNAERQTTAKMGNAYWRTENVRAEDVVGEYANPDTLTMTFEGMLYDLLTDGNPGVEGKLQSLFERYGYYLEYGYAWSLAIYPIDE